MVQPWQVSSLEQHGHCSYCGTPYPAGSSWPRTCTGCGETTWLNPLPVGLLLVPVRMRDGGRDGLVVVRRDIEPGRGELCLPGGFIEIGETWTEGAVRELREEAGLHADAVEVELFDVHSTPRHVLIFGIVPARDIVDLPESVPTSESTEWLILREAQTVAFPAHSAVIARYFASA